MSTEADNYGDYMARVLPEELLGQIPAGCLNCPRLLWQMKVHKDLNSRAQRLMNSWNPISRVLGKLENLEDGGFLKGGVKELIVEMQDCEGTIPNSELGITMKTDVIANWPNPEEIIEIYSRQCGLQIRDDIENQL